MSGRVLITGGAGFIGSHWADALLGAGYEVRLLDARRPQVHGSVDRPPASLSPEVEFIQGDVRHCFADISKSRRLLGYKPPIHLEDGLNELTDWLAGRIAIDRVDQATQELERRGLTL